MSTRGFRARLDRLARSAKRAIRPERDHVSDFTIDPALATALRDDSERHLVLLRKSLAPSENGGPLSASEVEEEGMLRVRIADRARAIGCPPNYAQKEYRTDSNRLHKLSCKRMSPPSCGGGTLSDAEDAEEAQLRARIEAFDQSPEGRARQRIFVLILRSFSGEFSTAEQNELDSLRLLYPDLPLDPNDPLKGAMEAFKAAIKKEEKASLKRQQDRLARDRTPRRSAGN